MTGEIAQLETDLTAAIAAASDSATLEEIRVRALGKKGGISALLKTLGQMSQEERQVQSPLINGLKSKITAAIAARKKVLETESLNQRLVQETEDITLPVWQSEPQAGRVHPLSQALDELIAIFADMGFDIADGPDIESDYYNFTALNIPQSHPARQMHDTFYIAGDEQQVLRTHTSPVQIRTMEEGTPPFRFIAPGRTYRCDSDQTHTPMFHQIEGLVIDQHIHLGHLKWTLQNFLASFFEVDELEIRFRPSYFPFTEPSMEVDIRGSVENGVLQMGKGDSWMEVGGSGMVHPNVLRAVKLDPDKVQGFAFGMGLDRLAMLKYGIPDLRDFFEADQRWLKHYGFVPLNIPDLARGLSG